MISVIVLVSAVPGTVSAAASAIVDVPGVAEVYSVAGEWDLIAIVKISDLDLLGEIITNGIASAPGVTKTSTHIAFKIFSSEVLDVAFDIGLD